MRSVEDLIDNVEELTKAGKLTWHSEDMVRNRFEVALPRGLTMAVWYFFDSENETSSITVNLISGDVAIDSVEADQFNSKFRRLSDFFDVARRSAHGVDNIVGDVLSELNKLARK